MRVNDARWEEMMCIGMGRVRSHTITFSQREPKVS